jgi:pyrimidine-specific ribonucleoside hydrolase
MLSPRMGPRRILVVVLAAALVAACSGGTDDPGSSDTVPGTRSPTLVGPTPLVVDTDMGVDDVLAILYAATDPRFDLRALTVTGTGLAHCEPGVRNALALLELIGKPDVLVACGPEAPLTGFNAFPTSWRLFADGFNGVEIPDPTADPSPLTAGEVLAQVIEGSARPVDVLTLGPLTTVGQLLHQRPSLPDGIGRLVAMGGAVDVPGNIIKNTEAEFNVWVDPHSANLVFRSGVPVTLVPLDATNLLPVTVFFVDQLRANQGPEAAELALEVVEANPMLVGYGHYFWDPLAAVVLTDPDLAETSRRRLWVVEEGEREILGDIRESEGAPEVTVVTRTDQLAFESRYLSGLAGAEVVVTRPQPDVTAVWRSNRCEIQAPPRVPAGRVVAELRSDDGSAAQLRLVRLLRGRTVRDVVRAIRAGMDEPPPWAELLSFLGVEGTDPTLGAWEIPAGSYALVCGGDDITLARVRPLRVVRPNSAG